MPKVIIEFTLPEQEREFRIALRGMDWAIALQDVDNQIRTWLKYRYSFRTPEEALEKTRAFIREALKEQNISFDMIA